MTKDPHWCERCQQGHPVISMVKWCAQQSKKENK